MDNLINTPAEFIAAMTVSEKVMICALIGLDPAVVNSVYCDDPELHQLLDHGILALGEGGYYLTREAIEAALTLDDVDNNLLESMRATLTA